MNKETKRLDDIYSYIFLTILILSYSRYNGLHYNSEELVITKLHNMVLGE